MIHIIAYIDSNTLQDILVFQMIHINAYIDSNTLQDILARFMKFERSHRNVRNLGIILSVEI